MSNFWLIFPPLPRFFSLVSGNLLPPFEAMRRSLLLPPLFTRKWKLRREMLVFIPLAAPVSLFPVKKLESSSSPRPKMEENVLKSQTK